jgi:hypothetical protein
VTPSKLMEPTDSDAKKERTSGDTGRGNKR